jgi:serine/threonine protein kinase
LVPNFDESVNSLNFRSSGSSSSSKDSNEDSESGAYYVHNKEDKKLKLKVDSTRTMRKFEIKKEDIDLENHFEMIGKGDFGKVYKTKLYSSTDVAVKIFDNNKIKNQMIKDSMEEAELLLSIRFPNIIMCMGWCMHSNLLMLVFEYMHQGSLFKVLHQDKKCLSSMTRLEILSKIARGMHHLHSREILHCDLKSSNVLLSDDFTTVKICDLGMSFLKNKLRKNNKWNSLSHYSSPEVLRGEKFENASDVYSFGMIIWEMLTGSIPYRDIDKSHLVGIVGYDCNHRLEDNDPKVKDRELYQLMLKTLNREPRLRPTFEEISEELDNLVFFRKKQLLYELNLGELLSCNE